MNSNFNNDLVLIVFELALVIQACEKCNASSVNKYSLNFSEIDMDADGLKKFVLKRIESIVAKMPAKVLVDFRLPVAFIALAFKRFDENEEWNGLCMRIFCSKFHQKKDEEKNPFRKNFLRSKLF